MNVPTHDLLRAMARVEAESEHDYPREFARSIQRQARRRGWKPSQKQIGFMAELYRELSANDDEHLIDWNDRGCEW